MYENRISELFQMMTPQNVPNQAVTTPAPGVAATAANLLPLVSVQDIYQMAAAQARHDYELDKLFNPEYYGDGAGI